MPKFGTEQEEVMREKTMKKGHLLLTLLAFVCLMGLGTIHANAATVKAKVDVKKFYGIAEQVLQEINRQRRNNGLSDLKMDANFTEVAMDIALQKQGGDASASNPEIYNNVYVRKDAMEIDDIDGYDEYSDNLWKETRNGKEKILNHIKKVGTFLYKESDITSKIGIGVVATDVPQGIPRELNYGGFCNVTYCFISNEVGHDDTNYNPYVNNGKTVRTQMDLYIDSSNTYLIVDANENCLTPKYTYDVIKKGEKRKAHPGVWQHPVIFGKVHNELCRFKCKLSNTGASWSSSDSSVVSVDSNGNITAKKNGIATVTVKVGSLQATKKYVVSDVIGMDTDTLLYLPNWKSKSDIPKEYTGNCYAGGYALEVKNGRITWSKNMKTNKITRPGSKKSTVKTKKLKGSYYKIISKSKRTVQYDEDNSVVLISYDKKKEIFSFVPYKKQIENIEDYGGMPQEKNTMQDDEEEYNEIGTEPIHLCEPQITDQDNSLEAVANENELSQKLLKFLEKEGEERRNFYVTSVENTGGKNFKAVLDFSTKRSDGKNISITFENGIYTFAFK